MSHYCKVLYPTQRFPFLLLALLISSRYLPSPGIFQCAPAFYSINSLLRYSLLTSPPAFQQQKGILDTISTRPGDVRLLVEDDISLLLHEGHKLQGGQGKCVICAGMYLYQDLSDACSASEPAFYCFPFAPFAINFEDVNLTPIVSQLTDNGGHLFHVWSLVRWCQAPRMKMYISICRQIAWRFANCVVEGMNLTIFSNAPQDGLLKAEIIVRTNAKD